jgi:ABC-type transporter Mla subunit MlaD
MGDLTNTLRWLAHASGEHDEARRAAMKQAADAIETLTARLAEAEEAVRGNAAFIKAQAEERARVRAETLEEAAKVADAEAEAEDADGDYWIASYIARRIRALATQENTDAA